MNNVVSEFLDSSAIWQKEEDTAYPTHRRDASGLKQDCSGCQGGLVDIHTSPTQYMFGRTPQFLQTPMGLTFGRKDVSRIF